MTTDRTAPARPATPAERSTNGPRKQEPATDVFAAILGAKAPAEHKRADAPKRPDEPRDDAAKPAGDKQSPSEQPGVVSDPAPTCVVPDPQAPAPVVPMELGAEQLAAQLSSPLPAPQPATTPAPAAPVAQAPAQPAAPAVQAPVQTAVPVQTQAPVTAAPQAQPVAQPTPATDPAAVAVPAVEAQPVAPIKTDDVKLPQAPVATAPQAQQPQADTAAQANAGDAGQPQSQPEQTAAPVPTPSTAPLADAPKAEAPAQPVAEPVQAPPPAAPAQQAAAPQRAVPLYRAPQVAAAVIHLAQAHGVTHARINLKPAELGGIEVRLHSTPQGIAAHLVADSPEAAKALQQASDDLRRQLEARDVNLLSLDVSTQGDDRREATSGAAFGGDGSPGGQNGGPRRGASESDQPIESPTETTLVLPDGVLVDVLA